MKPWKVGDRFVWEPLESDPIEHEIVGFCATIVAVVWMNNGKPIIEWYRIVELDEATRVEKSEPWKVDDWFYHEAIGYRCRIVDITLGRVAYHWRQEGAPYAAWDWVEMLDEAEHREPPLSWEGDR